MNDTASNQDASNTLLESQEEKKRQTSVSSTQKPSLLFSKRFLIAVLLFFSNISMLLLEYSININIIEMASIKQIKIGNLTVTQEPEFDWNSKTVGLVLSTSAYGRLLSFLSAPLILKFGGATTWALSMMAAGTAALLQPISLNYNFYLFLICRFLTGTFDSFFNASSLEACSRWIPKSERGTLISFSVIGQSIGLALSHPFCGFIASELGWSMVFYLTGAISVIVSSLCLILIRNKPSEDKWISKKELSYILNETDTICQKKDITRPYKTILVSLPIWALCTGNFVNGWIVTVLLACLPLFIKDLTHKGTKEVAFISSIPSIIGIFLTIFAGTLLDYFKNHARISLTRLHKILIGVSYISQMFLFITLALVEDLTTTVIIFILIRVSLPVSYIILRLISISIAPNHTGIVASIVTFYTSLSKIINQMVIGFMTEKHTLEEWNHCFILTAGIMLFGVIIFVLYGSSEAQPWSLSSNLQKQPHLIKKSELELSKKQTQVLQKNT